MTETDVERLIRELHNRGVKFVIIGGMAAIAQGSAYLTADLDLCYSREKQNLEKLAGALASFHPTLRDAPADLPFTLDVPTLRSGSTFTLATDFGDLDLFGELLGLGQYEEVLRFAEELELFGLPCKVLTLEGLVKSKEATGRPKDQRLLPELKALLEIQRTQKK